MMNRGAFPLRSQMNLALRTGPPYVVVVVVQSMKLSGLKKGCLGTARRFGFIIPLINNQGFLKKVS